jgi:cell division protein FtsB
MFQIQLKENLGTSLQDDMEELKSSNIESTRSQISMNRKEKKKRGKKKKIKKKEVLLELKELLPIIQENNILLKGLIQCFRSMETSLKALTQEPIKIQIVK